MNNEERVAVGLSITPTSNIELDYDEGILIIDDAQKIEEPVLVTIKDRDGWKIRKIFNYSEHLDYKQIPEVVIEIRESDEKAKQEELESRVKELLKNRLGGWETIENDAQIICEVINVLTSRGITVDHAASILRDSSKIIPKIKSL